MEIVPVGPGGPSLEPLFQDFRRQHTQSSEDMVLEALAGALATRQAQALVALTQGRPLGVLVLGRHGEEGRIHFLHALRDAPEVLEALLARAEETLRSAGSRRLSATLAVHAGDALEGVLARQGYHSFLRARMRLDLAALQAQPLPPAGYALSPWQDQRLEEAATLTEESHRGTDDAALYPEFSGPTGAQSMLERIVAGEFGPFDAALAPMALAGDALAAFCLSVWHTAFPDQGFILDLAVAPAHRRRGLGRALVVATAQAFRQAGATALGLAVTLSNEPALRLYQGLGFQFEQRFGLFRKALCPERK